MIKGRWSQLKGDARVQWGKLTDDDWERIAGNRLLAEVAGILSRELRDPMRERLVVSVLETLTNLSLIALD